MCASVEAGCQMSVRSGVGPPWHNRALSRWADYGLNEDRATLVLEWLKMRKGVNSKYFSVAHCRSLCRS